MERSLLYRYASAAAMTVLAGCGGSLTQMVPQADEAASRMAPLATRQDLLYVANTSSVTVYTYPQGTLVGTLNFPYKPNGLCADSNGDVYITTETTQKIYEYAHGGKRAIRTLKNPGYTPMGCAVDPVTGDLAVANYDITFAEYPGNVVVYRKGKRAPQSFIAPNIYYYFYCGYDAKGNLYVDGERNSGQGFTFAELRKGGDTFEDIDLGHSIGAPGGIQFDGTNLAVGDQTNPVIYEFVIRQGVREGTLVGTTPLDDADDVGQFDIVGSTLVAPNVNVESDTSSVLFYNYPAGGTPTQTIASGLLIPTDAVVSVAPSR